MATDLDGVARCRFGVRCGRMDSRRRTTLSGVVVASMAERPGTVGLVEVEAAASSLLLDAGVAALGYAQEEDVPARRRLLRPFDEGLVADILARLPTKSVLRFRAACKEWLRIIDSPAFVARHARRRPLEVLLYTRTTVASVEQQGLDALDVCAHRPATRRPLASFPGRDGTWKPYCSLLASCDGLLLLREDGAVDVDGAEHYLICNPATRQWSHLPRLTRGAGGQQDGRATHRESGFYFHEPSGG
uniref:Uncharacterized protein n=1 Tax=Aegilops tauschii TaxID=37682 RepID=R7W575_AEGTA